MTKYIKVKTDFNQSSSLYKYSEDFNFIPQDNYVVQTQFGSTIGRILPDSIPLDINADKHKKNQILHKAEEKDLLAYKGASTKAKEALDIAKEQIKEYQLPMKLINAHFFLNNNTVLFNFTSDTRVDFRNLVRSLAGIFKTRIELRQVGKRDEALLLGGHGVCGKELCCRQGVSSYETISIQMAKEQNIALNAYKISGLCDRLMCCIDYERLSYSKDTAKGSKDTAEGSKEGSKEQAKAGFSRCDNCVNTYCNHFLEKSIKENAIKEKSVKQD